MNNFKPGDTIINKVPLDYMINGMLDKVKYSLLIINPTSIGFLANLKDPEGTKYMVVKNLEPSSNGLYASIIINLDNYRTAYITKDLLDTNFKYDKKARFKRDLEDLIND